MPSIRIAKVTDLPRIVEIYNEAILHSTATFDTQPKTVSDQKAWFEKHTETHPIWVAEEEGVVAGWASINQWSDRCAYDETVENSVYVDPNFRKKGLGGALMDRLVSFSKEHRIHTIIARITDGNPASVQLHEKAGFIQTGVMKEVGLKFGKRLDVLIYQKFFS